MVTAQDWLAWYSWEFVTAQNLLLCQAKGALHKPLPMVTMPLRHFGILVIVSK
jgi:hypothetical protein